MCIVFVNCGWWAPPPPMRTPRLLSPELTAVPSGRVTAVCPLFHPITRAPGALPGAKPREDSAPHSLAVVKRPENGARPEAMLDTAEASPEQSVPAGLLPPGMYGVPDICAMSASIAPSGS